MTNPCTSYGTLEICDDDLERMEKGTEKALLATRNLGKEGVSSHMTVVNFLRGMVGPGCFSVPLALKYAGLWTGFSLLFVMGIVMCINMAKLVKCSQHLCAITGIPALNFGNMTEEAFKHSFPSIRRHALKAKIFINLCLFVLQLGVCSVCYIFMVDHLKEVIDHFWPASPLSEKYLLLIMFIPFCFQVSIRTFRALTYVSVFGNALMLVALVIIFQRLIRSPNIIPTLPNFTDFNGFMMSAGSILYAFEGQAIVLPLENKLKHPSEMNGLTGVLFTGMSLTTITYAFCGFYGYITYGADVEGSITLNMPNTPLIFGVKCLLTVVTFTGFLMQHYVVIEMYLPELTAYLQSKKYSNAKILLIEYANRYLIVVLAMGLSIAVPNLSDIIPLIGVSFGMILSLIVPPLIEWVTFLPIWLREPEMKKTLIYTSILNFTFVLLGFIFMISGLESNIKNLMDK